MSVFVKKLHRPLVSRVFMGASLHRHHWLSLAMFQFSLSLEFSDWKYNPEAVSRPTGSHCQHNKYPITQVSSVQFSCSVVSDSLRPHGLRHARPPCPSPSPGVYSNACPLSHDAIQPSHPLLSPSLSFNLSQHRVFSNSQFFASGGQSIGVSASTSVLPMNIQVWFPLGCTGWISLQSKGLSRVFSNTTVQKHQFFSPQLSL